MRKSILLLGFICMSILAFGQGIHFEKGTFDQALDKAKKEGKMVFVDAYAVWCGPCKWMANNVFKEPEVGTFFDDHIVAIKIDVERGEGPTIKSRYAIEGLPGYLFLDAEGNIVYRESGSMPTERFMNVVKTALGYCKDPNSVGRLAMRYATEKNDEGYLRTYLDKLKESGSAGYYDVVEQYLGLQKSMAPSSKEMVLFLNDHITSLTFGGVADRVIKENLGSEAWDLYVRKDIRKNFQGVYKRMAEQTVEYAIMKKDSTLVDLALNRTAEEGMRFQDGQRERILIYYYSQTGEGEKYKALITPQIEEFYNSLNVESLKASHLATMEKQRNNPGKRMISHATSHSEKLRHFVSEYARFVSSPEDQALVMKWSKRMYDILPTNLKNASFYAKTLYLYGDKNQGIQLMEEVVKQGEEDEKNGEGYKKDLEAMKAGHLVKLTF